MLIYIVNTKSFLKFSPKNQKNIVTIFSHKKNNCDAYGQKWKKHPFSKLSGVFYVKIPKNSGDLIFVNETEIPCFIDHNNITEFNNYNSFKWSIKPEENVLYLFPSWLGHYVNPNLSKEKRISISFNLT